MTYALSCLVVLLVTVVNNSHQKQLPSFIKRCKFTTDEQVLGECIKNTFNENREKLIQGVPELHIPILDPFVVDKIIFNTGNGSAVGLNAIFTNVKVEGARTVVINRVETDVTNAKTLIDVFFPTLRIMAEYVLDGRVMILPINGSGHSDGNFTDLHSLNHLEGKFVTRHNKEYIEWVDQKIDLSIGGMSLHFDDLFNGNKELTESTNKMINENSAEIMKELKTLVEDTVSSITFSMMQRVFHTFSIEELFEK